jgi:hypothetical protein
MTSSTLNQDDRLLTVSPTLRRRGLWVLLVITLLIMLLMNLVGAPLVNQQAPSGIVSYELAWRLEKSQAILASWDARAQRYAAFGLGFDYLFMLAYSSLFALACLQSGEALAKRGWPLAGWNGLLAASMFLAAAFDAVENLGLSIMLLEAPANPWPWMAGACASLKFGLLFLGLVYIFYTLAVVFLGRVEKH